MTGLNVGLNVLLFVGLFWISFWISFSFLHEHGLELQREQCFIDFRREQSLDFVRGECFGFLGEHDLTVLKRFIASFISTITEYLSSDFVVCTFDGG